SGSVGRAVICTAPGEATPRTMKDWYAFDPGWTLANVLRPYGVTTSMSIGTLSSFATRTARYGLPARQRVCTVGSTRTAAELAYTATSTSPAAQKALCPLWSFVTPETSTLTNWKVPWTSSLVK